MNKQVYPEGNQRFSFRAFTLIEILVVVAVVGLVASVVVVALKGAKQEAEIANILRLDAQIYHALGAHSVGVWNLDEGSGSVAEDFSRNDNNGTIVDADWVDDTPSGKGYALEFDGSNSYVQLPPSNSIVKNKNNFGVTAWFKSYSIPSNITWNRIITLGRKDTEPGTAFALLVAGDDKQAIVRYYDKNSNYNYFPVGTVTLNQWHFFAATFDGEKFVAWLDEEQTIVDEPSDFPNVHDVSFLGFGAYYAFIGTWGPNPGGDHFHGVIDQVRVYEHVLDLSQVEKIYVEGTKKKGLAIE